MEILLPNTNAENLEVTSIELSFAKDINEKVAEQFVEELISVATKYEAIIDTLQFNDKENK